jgi:uncharacterized iron-regulated protein
MTKFISIVFFITFFLGPLCKAQISESHYKIYSTKLNKEVSLDEIANEMTNYDVLFFGEEHNDSVTHFLENKMLETLFKKYPHTALSMEMFDRDLQVVMDDYLTGGIREKNFKKDARVWSNYRDYRPMVEFAKTNGLDIICANAPSRYTNLVGRKGQKALMALSKESKRYFAPLPYDTATGKYYQKLMDLTGHGANPVTKDTSSKKAPPAMSMGNFNLILGQSLWDATMAYSIFEYLKKNKGKKVMQINGRFHSDEGFAVVTQLKKYSPKLKTLIISCGSDEDFPNIEWQKHQHLGDFIIITDPKVPKTYDN